MTEENKISEQDIKIKIITATLSLVSTYGWTEEALLNALKQEALSRSYAWRLFPKGISDVIQQWNFMLDQEMLEKLQMLDESTLKTTEKVKIAIKTRFQLLFPYKREMIQAWAFLSSPSHVRLKLKITYNTINKIWYFAGDQSVDFNFYTKRGLLLGVYVTTLLYWFNDFSESSEETWNFLDRQLKRVGYIPRIKGYAQQKAAKLFNQIQNIANRFTP